VFSPDWVTHVATQQLLAISVVILTGGLSAPASAADWQQIAVDDAANRYSVDADRIIREGDLVKAFVRTEYATPAKTRPAAR